MIVWHREKVLCRQSFYKENENSKFNQILVIHNRHPNIYNKTINFNKKNNDK